MSRSARLLSPSSAKPSSSMGLEPVVSPPPPPYALCSGLELWCFDRSGPILHASLYLDAIILPYYTGIDALSGSRFSDEWPVVLVQDTGSGHRRVGDFLSRIVENYSANHFCIVRENEGALSRMVSPWRQLLIMAVAAELGHLPSSAIQADPSPKK
uniref:Uncharacterized protein n=1 Tax=Ananas comosus var. bracteatus TaxID=296719 RepID=A0A6V7PXQ3_ANACO|nr:unnamed protein product [Ananas comosus var. bracteatus]